jgi:membrane-bound inhibitor of C-type lysozyme
MSRLRVKLRAIRPALALACCCGMASAADKPVYFAAYYGCDNGSAIRVAYPVDYLAGHPITLRYDNKRVTMRQTISASGARYESRDKRLEWFIKGDEGMLIDGASTVHCKVSPPRTRKAKPSS